ncbi:MAG: hypothetical protein JJT81_17825 [Rubellimicrobium sp.]|nr:hypothetical protein [Rubellimicrobium sp.]
MVRFAALLALVLTGAQAIAQGYHEPERGSAERRALMDAIRPNVEGILGAPVEFVVDKLRVSGDVGFATLRAQRPGGAAIDIRATPVFAQGLYDPEGGDPRDIEALFLREGNRWVVADWGSASTDVWWSYGPICQRFRAVIPEYC